MGATSGVIERASRVDGFFPIELSDLRLDSVLGFDIYLAPQPGDAPVLYRHRELDFSEEVRLRLRENRIESVYVPNSQERSYNRYMESNIRSALTDASLSVAQRTQILYATASEMVREFLTDPTDSEVIPRTREVVGAAVDHLLFEQSSFSAFLRSSPLDYRTYTHSVDVAMYTLHLAQFAGIDDLALLREIGMGTFLHDLGKYRIPNYILNKPNRLTDAEWRVMRKHPTWGHEILRGHGVTSPVVLGITRDHHEKMDGSGYPRGVRAGTLPDFVRMTTVCDVFDALTTQRAYKNRLKSFPALEIMKGEMLDELDPEYFAAFIQMLHVQQ